MRRSEEVRQLDEARERFLNDHGLTDDAVVAYERVIERILQGEEVYVLGFATEKVWM